MRRSAGTTPTAWLDLRVTGAADMGDRRRGHRARSAEQVAPPRCSSGAIGGPWFPRAAILLCHLPGEHVMNLAPLSFPSGRHPSSSPFWERSFCVLDVSKADGDRIDP